MVGGPDTQSLTECWPPGQPDDQNVHNQLCWQVTKRIQLYNKDRKTLYSLIITPKSNVHNIWSATLINVLPPIPNCFSWLLVIPSTHFTHSYLHNLPSPTTWDLVLTIWHYQTNIVLLTVVLLSLGCRMPIVIDFVTVISFFFLVMSAAAVCHLHNKQRYMYIYQPMPLSNYSQSLKLSKARQ